MSGDVLPDGTARNFQDLLSHREDLLKHPGDLENINRHFATINTFLSHSEDGCITFKDFIEVYGRVVINDFEICNDLAETYGFGVYLGPSILDHSCVPNASVAFRGKRIRVTLNDDYEGPVDFSRVFISYIDSSIVDPEKCELGITTSPLKFLKKMRGNRNGAALPGEPCQVPVKLVERSCLLQDARNNNLHQMKKRMRNSIFKKVEDVNQTDERNCTPLHYAAKHGNRDMIRFLVDKGADLKAEDKHGWSVLQYAVRYAPLESVQLLLDLEADIHHKEKKGWTCLHLAARNGHPNKARMLLENGADVRETQNQGWNSLHLAVRYGQPDTISILLEYGIDINADNLGWTALHLAALNGHCDIVSILLNKGAVTSTKNLEGKTALDIAREEGHERIAAIILETDFQSQPNQDLPTPPETPPTAPPIELFARHHSPTNAAETIEEWRSRIQRELEEIHAEPTEDGERRDGTMDSVRITWKTLEEEEEELMKQLERVRLKEVNRLKDEMIKKRTECKKQVQKMERKSQALSAQIQTLKDELPTIEARCQDRVSGAESLISRMDTDLDRLKKELEMVAKLRELRCADPIRTEWTVKKSELTDQLEQTLKSEMHELESDRRGEVGRVADAKLKAETDSRLVEEKIQVLESELSLAAATKTELQVQLEDDLEDLRDQLERAERRTAGALNNLNAGDDENWFGCPVCMSLLKPPMRIFQCPEGHILCEECKENPAMVHCPQCRTPLEGQCSRNRALEEVARSYFPTAPSETL